jgi:hypothetical protein
MSGTINTFYYVGLCGPKGAAKMAFGSRARARFTGLTTQLLAKIPCLTKGQAARIAIDESVSARVPGDILAQGLKWLTPRTLVINPSVSGAPVHTFGQLVKLFEKCWGLMSSSLPSGWEESNREVKDRGVSVSLNERLSPPNLVLWFRIINLLEQGQFEYFASYVPIPMIRTLDVVKTDAAGAVVRAELTQPAPLIRRILPDSRFPADDLSRWLCR